MPNYVDPIRLTVHRSLSESKADGLSPVTPTDITRIQAIEHRYRKWNGSAIVEMTAGEKAVVDQDEDVASRTALKTSFDDNDLIKAITVYFTKQINTLRAAHSIAPLTGGDVRTGIRQEIDNG